MEELLQRLGHLPDAGDSFPTDAVAGRVRALRDFPLIAAAAPGAAGARIADFPAVAGQRHGPTAPVDHRQRALETGRFRLTSGNPGWAWRAGHCAYLQAQRIHRD